MESIAYKSTIGSGNIGSGNVTDSNNINNINYIGGVINVGKAVSDESPEIMQWLSPLDARGRHQDVCANRLGGVGSWVLEANEFRKWRSSEGGANGAVLFCYGNPGVGKTYLTSLVIDDLCDGPGEEDIATAMFYCDFRDQQQQTATNIMGAILKQLVARGEALQHVQTAFQKVKKEIGGRSLVLAKMVQLMNQVIAKLPRVFICIDALDECLPKHLLELLESFKDILQASPRTRIFVTGRPQVEAEIKRFFTALVIVPISPKPHDIKRYLERKLEMDTDPDAMSDGLRKDILRIIPEKMSDIFLLVSLNIDAILEAATVSERRRKLMEMTKGNHLGDGYATTLARIKAQKGSRPRLGMDALMWVSNSERPLRTRELCHALGVEIGSADLDAENVPTIRTLLTCSLGLITVEASSDTARLVHLTLQDYLSNTPSLFQGPHAMIAEVCLTYLNFESIRELAPTLSSPPSTFPLVEYASWYWGKHIRQKRLESVSTLALGLLTGFEHHISSQLLLKSYNNERRLWEPGFDTRDGPVGFTGLHGAAFLGIGEIIAGLLAMNEWDVNATDGLGRTALAWAAVGGHEDIVKMLLQRKDVDPNATDTVYGCTPLWLAAGRGYDGIVKLLLERGDINPNTADTGDGRTPLRCAAEGGHGGVLKLLLERQDINPNTADTKYGQTPLWCAVEGRDEGVVKLLLEREDTNPNIADDSYGRTPLLWAAVGGLERVVKLLLEREDTKPNIADTIYGRTPLWFAAAHRREAVVKLLLERKDIDPNTTDTKCGQTPLCCAAVGGNEGVVKLLLEREDTRPNTADAKYGGTPLWWAAVYGHEGVVKLLLDRADINSNTPDTGYGQSPLWYAARGGYEGVVKLLLEREDINSNTADTLGGQAPLSWAARGGCAEVVRLLLKREDVNPDSTDTEDARSALSWAARRGLWRMVLLLLEQRDIDPNAPDTEYGRTPLSWAAAGGHELLVKLLLERVDVDPNTADNEKGPTPLSWAARGGHEHVVRLLLRREDINPDSVDSEDGRTPLLWAAEGGHVGVVKLLLQREDVNPDIPNLSGKTALELATSCGHTAVVELRSKPRPSLPALRDLDNLHEHPSPKPSGLPQIAIRSFLICSFLVFLFCFLFFINPLTTNLLLSPFRR